MMEREREMVTRVTRVIRVISKGQLEIAVSTRVGY